MHADNFSDPDEGYQSLSTGAVAALVLGILSPTVVFGTLLMVLPCLGIVLALASLRQIASSDGALTGRGLALAGLALATACLCGRIAYIQADQRLLHAQATPSAQALLAALQQGEHQQAYLLTLPGGRRAATQEYFQSPDHQEDPLGSPGRAEMPEANFESFLARPAVAELTAGGEITGFELVSRDSAGKLPGGRAFAVQTYRVRRQPNHSLLLQLTLQRAPGPGVDWRVADLKSLSPQP